MAMGILILLVLYVVPSIIAFMRGHKDAPAIAAVNIIFGWSVFGWIWTFIWALADPRGRGAVQTVVVNTTQHNTPAERPAQPLADPDTIHWDSIEDKRNPDALEEYLVRFPEGRFAVLARQRLGPGSSSTQLAAD
ncbi:MAG TPA: superinfection immunity protein [Caulobacteraceae bacterium]|jgi:hypothetical protein|nr:superinfection immunity protein [Caulobacteraceae bacterium]